MNQAREVQGMKVDDGHAPGLCLGTPRIYWSRKTEGHCEVKVREPDLALIT